MGNLIDHARTELEILGEEPATIDGYLAVIQAFSAMGHSGGSAMVAIPVLTKLLQYQNLAPLTNDPNEWNFIGEETWGEKGGIWQNRRNSEAFSRDKGKTFYLVSDPDKKKHKSVKSK